MGTHPIVEWMWAEFPGLFYVLGQAAKGRDKREAVYRGMYLGGDQTLTSGEWMETNIRQGHGPLGVLYPTRTWTAPNPYSAIKEGDTPSWFYFLPNGLNVPDQPTWGGWGGRFVQSSNHIYRDGRDTVDTTTDGRCTVWRWRDAFQRDFQARMDWCVQPRAAANHAPIAVCNGDATPAILALPARSGSTIRLSAAASQDPDGDRLTYRWWVYPEAGTYPNTPGMTGADSPQAAVALPPSATGELHIILEVTDAGEPPLTSYRRVILTVN